MKKLFIILCLILSLQGIRAQTVIEVKPLFEYPVAPEELQSLEDKCNYLVKNFWNNFDFKNKGAVDQYALNEAFLVYVTAFRYADVKEVNLSIEKLLKNLSSNPLLLMQFGKAAEENLYGPRADYWSDPLYLKFIDAIIKNKKVPEARKTRYRNQAGALTESAIENVAPTFWFENPERASKQYFPMSTPTLLIFGNPDDTDWRLSRLKMDSNLQLQDALEKGKINILFIIPEDLENWQKLVDNYNKRWTVGQASDASKHYDTRLQPSIFLVGSQGKILYKNLDPEKATELILELVNQ